MKKSIISLALLSAVAFMTTGCSEDRLEIEQKGYVSMDKFYQTDDDAVSALNAAYAALQSNLTTSQGGSIYVAFRAAFNICGDDMLAAGEFFGDNDFMGAMNEFRYDNTNAVLEYCYKNLYYSIYYDNLVIDNFKNGTSAVQKKCVAEAKVLRAYLHMMLAIGWGNAPKIDHCIDYAELPTNSASQAELLQWCAKECEEALPFLDERESKDSKEGAVRVTSGFANAVAGKCYLFLKDYAKAKTALRKVIDSGKYELIPGANYADNFHVQGDCNKEKIFESNIEFNWSTMEYYPEYMVTRCTWMEANIWNWRGDHFVKTSNPCSVTSSIDGWGGCGLSKEFADELIAYDGVASPRLNTIMVHIDTLMYGTHYNTMVDGLSRAEKLVSDSLGIARPLYGNSFWLPKKQIATMSDLTAPTQNTRVNNYTIMRYAEVLLMYAEACAMTTDEDGMGLASLKEVNTRAGSATSITALSLDAVKKEKKFEMWLEGCRWADLVRWGDTAGVANAGQNIPVLCDKRYRPVEATDEDVIWENGTEANSRFYTYKTHAAKDRGDVIGFKAGKHEFFPYPHAVTSINGNLVQKGW